MRVLDLFSGIGGFSLGLERAGMETVAFCEIDPFCRKVLRRHWPNVPIHEDIRELSADAVGPVDLICGGYPCQPFSHAGKRRGAQDDRHLWPEYLRLIREIRPAWVIGENVAGHISMGLDQVLADLEGEGYAWEAFVIPACAVDAPHRRDRVWIIGDRDRDRDRESIMSVDDETSRMRSTVADSVGIRLERIANSRGNGATGQGINARCEPAGGNHTENGANAWQYAGEQFRQARRTWREWESISRYRIGANVTESPVCRANHGIPRRLDRLKALGNAVVPQIPEIIGRAIMAIAAERAAGINQRTT